MKAYRRAHNVRERPTGGDDSNEDADDENLEEVTQSAVDELRTTVVTEANLDRMKVLLLRTLQYRSKLMKNQSTDLFRTFAYFFTHPQLVTSDFLYHIKRFYRFVHFVTDSPRLCTSFCKHQRECAIQYMVNILFKY